MATAAHLPFKSPLIPDSALVRREISVRTFRVSSTTRIDRLPPPQFTEQSGRKVGRAGQLTRHNFASLLLSLADRMAMGYAWRCYSVEAK